MCAEMTASGTRAGERGAALVEMSIVVPLIAVLGLGVMEFANYFFNYQLVSNGVRDAARFAASLPYDPADKTRNDAAIKSLAVTGATSGGTQRVAWWTEGNVTVAWGSVTNAALSGGAQSYRYNGDVPVVTVSTSVAYPSLGFLGFLGIGSIAMQASHKERVFGVR